MTRINNFIESLPACQDPDAQAYFSAAGITDSTEKLAACALIETLKATTATAYYVGGTSVWDLCKGIYLFSPTSLAAASVNAKNPGTNDLIFSNSPTHSAQGVEMNGVDQYADTGLLPSELVEFKRSGVYWQQNLSFSGEAHNSVHGYEDAQAIRSAFWWIPQPNQNRLVWKTARTTDIETLPINETQPWYMDWAVNKKAAKGLDGESFNNSSATDGINDNATYYIGARNRAIGGVANAGVARWTTFINFAYQIAGEGNTILQAIQDYNDAVISGGR